MKQTPVSHYSYRSPKSLRKRHVNFDNIALVPASELASLAKWKEYACQLPDGDTLLVLPQNNPRLQAVGQRICDALNEQGRHTTIENVAHHTG